MQWNSRSSSLPRNNVAVTLQEFRGIYVALNRRAELKRLIQWAILKKLAGPNRLYQYRLQDEEMRLRLYRDRTPHLFNLANMLYRASLVVRTTPRYPTKGSAAIYLHRGINKSQRKPI